MELATNLRVAPPVRRAERRAPASPAEGIASVWALHSALSPRVPPRQALPDGCAYLLFGFDAECSGRRELLHARLIGPRTRPFFIDERPRLCVGVRIAPGFAQAAFGLPASEFLDQRLDYDLVYSDADAELESIAAATTDTERVAGAIALARRRFRSAVRIPSSVRAAVSLIVEAEGNVRVGSLVERIGVTRQHLARQFSAHVGMTVKQFTRVKRADAARARAQVARTTYPRRVNWATIAHELGYYDQAHFINDFKSLTGLTPGKWIRYGA